MGEQAAMTATRQTEVEPRRCMMCDGRGCIDMSDDDTGKVIRCPECLGYGIAAHGLRKDASHRRAAG